MSATHDTSVLFSLNKLMDLYETRVQEEEQEAARKAELEARARAEAARAAEEQAARKAQEEALQKAREEAAEREEAARLEAIRLGAIERARIEAEKQAQIEMQKRAREHELALESLREDEKKKKLERAIKMGVVCGAMAVVGAVGLYFGKLKPEYEARLVQQAADINAQFEETRRLEAQFAANQKRIAKAESLLQQSKEAAAAAAPTAPPPAAAPPVSKPKGAAGATIKPQTKGGACLPGEPGCDLNGNRLF